MLGVRSPTRVLLGGTRVMRLRSAAGLSDTACTSRRLDRSRVKPPASADTPSLQMWAPMATSSDPDLTMARSSSSSSGYDGSCTLSSIGPGLMKPAASSVVSGDEPEAPGIKAPEESAPETAWASPPRSTNPSKKKGAASSTPMSEYETATTRRGRGVPLNFISGASKAPMNLNAQPYLSAAAAAI